MKLSKQPHAPMRRATPIIAFLLALGLIAAGCGGDDEVAETPDEEATDDPTEEPEETDEAPEAETDEADGALIIDGEEIADAELWAAAQEEGTLTLYSSVSEARQQVVLDQWAELDLPLDVELVRLGGGRLYERVQSEHASGQLAADVILHSDKALVEEHAASGVFDPYCVPNLDEIPDELKGGGDDCVFQSGVMVPLLFGYNSALLDEADAPSTNLELLETDELRDGQIAIQHIAVGGSSWAWYFHMRQEYGVEYWEDLADMNVVLTGAAGASQEQIVRGEQVHAPMNTVGNINVAVDDGAPITGKFPEDGAVAIGHWMGKAAGAENPNAAEVFLNWWYSSSGQAAVAFAGDYSPVAGSPAPRIAGVDAADVPDISEFAFPEADEEYAILRDEWFDEWQVIFDFTPES